MSFPPQTLWHRPTDCENITLREGKHRLPIKKKKKKTRRVTGRREGRRGGGEAGAGGGKKSAPSVRLFE